MKSLNLTGYSQPYRRNKVCTAFMKGDTLYAIFYLISPLDLKLVKEFDKDLKKIKIKNDTFFTQEDPSMRPSDNKKVVDELLDEIIACEKQYHSEKLDRLITWVYKYYCKDDVAYVLLEYNRKSK